MNTKNPIRLRARNNDSWPGLQRAGRTAALIVALLFSVMLRAAEPAEKIEGALVGCGHPNLFLAPYVWKQVVTNGYAQVEATMPGAYLKALVEGTTRVGLVVDGFANIGCPASSMPVVEFSIDQGPFQIVPLSKTGAVYTLPMAEKLDPGKRHVVNLFFRAADLIQKRWTTSTAHLRIAGLALDAGGTALPVPLRAKRALGYGDSITEGVGADGLFTSWSIIHVNNARATWFPLVCAALNCEYGQLGSGGWGVSKRKLEVPPLTETWDRYDAFTSRLVDGRLDPEPDYVFCCLGTNDPELDITADYTRWLAALRQATAHASVFCIVPPLGVHRLEIEAAVKARNQAGDARVYLIHPAAFEAEFRAGQGPTALAYDGVHPSLYGNAVLGAFIAAEAQKRILP